MTVGIYIGINIYMYIYIYKMYMKEVSIKNIVYNYYLYNLIKAKKLETSRNILIDEKKL